MLAKIAASLPEGAEFLFEPKWDGFRAIVFRRDGEVLIQSRDAKPLDRYFPDLHEVFVAVSRRKLADELQPLRLARAAATS
jgi:ATP-dependent DNA ligase